MKMKRLIRWAAALGMTALLLCGSAFAAGENTIAVQLNGENLTFTDAVPQVKAQRTFLPFRAVFEAMGAQVGNEGNVITATRGDKTLTMTIGETAATVTANGIEVPITMDVAPYVDNATWRTYVPVRFAAQAFDCAVGWDQEAYTAIIVDTEKLVEEALEGKKFTYLEKLTGYSEKYNEGIWDMTMDMTGSMGIMGANMPLSAAVTGTSQDQNKLSMDMNMKMDMSQILQLISMLGQNADMTSEDRAMLEALAVQGIDMRMRGDMEAGKLYMMLGGSLMETAGIPADTWFLMDVNDIYAQAGIDMNALLQASEKMDAVKTVKTVAQAFLSTMTPVSASGEGYGISYADFKNSAEGVIAALSDDGFQKEGNEYTTLIDGGMNTLSLTLTMRSGKVTGYTMDMNMAAANEEMGMLTMNMTIAMDNKDQLTAGFDLNAGGVLSMELDMNAKYTAGKKAPETTPPTGAVVLPLDQMMGADLGVIGGADGPTAVIGQ